MGTFIPGGKGGGGGGGGGAATLSGNTVETLYEDTADYTFTGDTGGAGSNSRTVTLTRELTADDVGKLLKVFTVDQTDATVRTAADADADVADMEEQHQVIVTSELIAGTKVVFLESYNLSNGQVGWSGASAWMSAADTFLFRLRLNRADPTVRQRIVLAPQVEHLEIDGGGLVDTSGIGSLNELAEQPALNDDLGILDRSASNAKRVKFQNLGIHILPDLNGHAPNPSDRDDQEAYVDAGVPALINGVMLYPRFEVHPGHTGRADWLYFHSLPDQANVGSIDAPAWASGTDYVVGDIVLTGSGASEIVARCIQAHTSTAGTQATGDPDDENTGYHDYWDITSAPTLEGLLTTSSPLNTFKGVVEHISELTTPANGDWLYLVVNEQVTAERYQPNGWYNFIPPNVHRLLPYAATEELVYPEIQYISSSQRTWAIIGTRLALLLAYTGPTAAQERFVWKRRDSVGRPELYDNDATIAGAQDQAIITDIDVPSGHTWGFVNFGDLGAQRSGAWHRFLVDDLTTRTVVAAGDSPGDDNALMFPLDTDQGYLMRTAAGKIAVAISANAKITTAMDVRVRVD